MLAFLIMYIPIVKTYDETFQVLTLRFIMFSFNFFFNLGAQNVKMKLSCRSSRKGWPRIFCWIIHCGVILNKHIMLIVLFLHKRILFGML